MPQQHNNMMKITTTVIVSVFGPVLCAEPVPDLAPTEAELGAVVGSE